MCRGWGNQLGVEDFEIGLGIRPRQPELRCRQDPENFVNDFFEQGSRAGIRGQLAVAAAGEGAEWIEGTVVEHLRPEYAAHIAGRFGRKTADGKLVGQGSELCLGLAKETAECNRRRMGCYFNVVFGASMEAGDDACVKKARLGPEVLKGDFVAPSILAEQESRRPRQIFRDRPKFLRKLGGREGLGADEQPLRWLVEEAFDTGEDFELFRWNLDLAKETGSPNALFTKRDGEPVVANQELELILRPSQRTREPESDRSRSPDRDSQDNLQSFR